MALTLPSRYRPRRLDSETRFLRPGERFVPGYRLNRGAIRWIGWRETIAEFEARIQNQGDPAPGLPIHIQIENQRMRIWAGPSRLGSWPLEEVSVERLTPFRFRVIVDGDPMIVTPDDPTGFAATTGAFVDVRQERFGLADRIRTSREA